jgi:hypothetical protein
MKLGTETNSLVNHLLSRTASLKPEVGMGCTILHWTDRSPATVVSIDDKFLVIQSDGYVRTDSNGMSESQTYEYSPDPNGGKYTFKMWKGQWKEVQQNPETGRWTLVKGGTKILIGRREKYEDFTF